MIDRKETKHISELARIGVTDEDLEKFSQDLSSVLDWIKKMEKIDVSGVAPTNHITGMENVFRDDQERDFSDKEKIIELFPERKDNYDKVKSVL